MLKDSKFKHLTFEKNLIFKKKQKAIIKCHRF